MGVPISGYGMYLNDSELEGLVDRISHDEQAEEDYGHVDCAMDLCDMYDGQLLNHDNMWGGWRVRFLGDDHDTFNDDGTELTGVFLFAMKQGDIIAGSKQLYSSVKPPTTEVACFQGCMPAIRTTRTTPTAYRTAEPESGHHTRSTLFPDPP